VITVKATLKPKSSKKPPGPIRGLHPTHEPLYADERKIRGVVWCGRCTRLLWTHRPLMAGITTDAGQRPCQLRK
jgi:hypothetical protein